MLEWIVVALVAGPVTLVLHELTHAAVVEAQGARLTVFEPWPHRHQPDGGSKRRWYIGRTGWEWTDPKPQPVEVWQRRAWTYVAPLIKAWAMAMVWTVLAVHGWAPLAMAAAWEVIDASWWLRGFLWGAPHTDGQIWKNRRTWAEKMAEARPKVVTVSK